MTKKTSTFDYEILVRYMLPNGVLDTFEVTNVEEECTGVLDETQTEIRILHIYLDERDMRDDVWHDLKPNGFTDPRVFNDLPQRKHKVAFQVHRRRWLSADGRNHIFESPPCGRWHQLLG